MIKQLLVALSIAGMATGASADNTTVRIFDEVVFYDGYMGSHPDKDLDDGVLRHRTSLCAVKLTDEQLDKIGNDLTMNVTVGACCDNYDRIGNVNLAFVPKGSESYENGTVQRIELGRFITPFMDMNKRPRQITYGYWMDYLSLILRDSRLRQTYDLWMELEIFGMPYTANSQVKGCENRSDVFKGTLELISESQPAGTTDKNIIVPIVMKNPEYITLNLNNYQTEATDEIGTTKKTYTFTVPEDVTDSQIVLVISNHGANEGGEEYTRRQHFIYVDDELALTFLPGRESCEPFRRYNTQANTVYGYSERKDEWWQTYRNWCPGDVLDNRIINLGALSRGEHTVTVSVPDAVFINNQGDFPVSIFFQGVSEGKLPVPPTSGIESVEGFGPSNSFIVNVSGRTLSIIANASAPIEWIEVRDINGRCLRRQHGAGDIDASGWAAGTYLVSVETEDGLITTRKTVIR